MKLVTGSHSMEAALATAPTAGLDSCRHVGRTFGGTRGRNRRCGMPALLTTITHHEADVAMVWSPHHLGKPVTPCSNSGRPLSAWTEGGDPRSRKRSATVETGGLLAVAELPVDARRRYRARAIRAGQFRSKGL
jgi:hypothetical protein